MKHLLARSINVLLFSFFLLALPIKVYALDPIGNWSQTISLPYSLASHAGFSFKDKIYVLGGSVSTGQSHNDVSSSKVNFDGTLMNWVNEGSSLTAPIWHSVVRKDNFVYVLGGREENSGTVVDEVATVYYGVIQPDGSLTEWHNTNSLPAARAQGGAVAVGNWLYFAGGADSVGKHNQIYYAPILSDGTLGSWSTSSISLPAAMNGIGMVAHDNSIYVIGGIVDGVPHDTILDTVYKTTVNTSNGSLTAWQPLATRTAPFTGVNQTIIVGSLLISIGGGAYGDPIDPHVYYAKIKDDGTLEPWQVSSNVLPQGIASGALMFTNGYLYLTGGVGSIDGYTDKVYYAKLATAADLNVPLLKQTSAPWGNQLYDSANLWAPVGSRNISNWGCAITSAAMVFQYNKIKKLPDGSILDPKTLNAWLKSRPLGYVREGWLNWAELAVLSKLAKNKNPDFAFDTLEYKYSLGENKTQLSDDLSNNIPGILEEPGHFVVAKGTDGVGGFSINDPYYNRTDLSSYGNTFSKQIRFVPSHSDLSYIILMSDGNTEVALKDNSDNSVGDTFLQDPLVDDVGGGTQAGGPLRVTQIAQPDSGKFHVEVSSPSLTKYVLDIILYDKNGNGKKVTISGIAGPGGPETYLIDFNKTDLSKTTAKKEVTFDTLLTDVNELCASGEIKIYCPAIVAQVKTAKSAAGFKPTVKAAISILKALDNQIGMWKGKGVSQSAYDILHSDLQTLIANL